MKKIIISLVIIVAAFVGFYVWATSGMLTSDQERYVIYKSPTADEVVKDTFSIMTFNIGYLSGMTNNKAYFYSAGYSIAVPSIRERGKSGHHSTT